MKRALLLTGQPGTGKTTIIKEALAATKVNAGGFYTVTQAIGSGKMVLGTVMFNSYSFADQIKRHPAVETLLVTSDNRTEVVTRVLDWIKNG